MSDFDPDKYLAKKKAFDPDEYLRKKAAELNPPSEMDSILRGAAQGATFGFADEATGALESLKDIAMTDKELSDYMDLYKQHRDESRREYKTAEETNPGSYFTGQLGGGIASSFIPVIGQAKAATLAGKMAIGAGQGALASYGLTDKEGMDGLTDVGIGAGIGAAAPAVMAGAGKVIDKVAPKAKALGKNIAQKVGKVVFGVDEKATERYLANPSSVNKAQSIGELADAVLNTVDDGGSISQMKQKASDLSSKSFDVLSKDKSIPKFDVLQAINDGQEALMVDGNLVGKAQKRAFNELTNLADDLKNMPDDLPEPTLKKLIQAYDKNINWDDPSAKSVNDSLKSLRTFVDERLKGQNQDYKKIMSQAEDVSKSIKQVEQVFKNRQNPQSYDKFNKAIKNLANKDDMSAANQAVDKIKQHTGYNLRDDILDSWTKGQFSKGDINGSRKTVLGGIIGAGIGLGVGNPIIGGAIGSTVGYTADRYSGLIFKKLLDGSMSAAELSGKMGKFAKPLMEAAQRGHNAVNATHFLLQQSSPEYREYIKRLEKEDGE